MKLPFIQRDIIAFALIVVFIVKFYKYVY